MQLKIKETERIDQEIEKLKIETELKRRQLSKLKNEETRLATANYHVLSGRGKFKFRRKLEWRSFSLISINKLILARERSEEEQKEKPQYQYSGECLLGRDVKIK